MIWTYLKYLSAIIFVVGAIILIEGTYIIGGIIIVGDFFLLAISCICDYLFRILNNARDINESLKRISMQRIHEQIKKEED